MALLKSSTIKRMVKTNALRQGLFGGSPLWRAVFVGQFLMKGWNRLSKGGEAPVTFTEPLTEGEAWTLVHVPEKSARGRGEGRRLIVGPKRKRPRASALVGPALSAVGAKILEAPSAERINAIVGENVVEDPKPSRRQRRREKKVNRKNDRVVRKDAKAWATQRRIESKIEAKQAKVDAKASLKRSRIDSKADKKQAKVDVKAAKKRARLDAKAAKKVEAEVNK